MKRKELKKKTPYASEKHIIHIGQSTEFATERNQYQMAFLKRKEKKNIYKTVKTNTILEGFSGEKDSQRCVLKHILQIFSCPLPNFPSLYKANYCLMYKKQMSSKRGKTSK